MRPFDYYRARSVDHALNLLTNLDGDAIPLAGGQSLLLALKQRAAAPRALIDVGRLEELRSVVAAPDRLVLGAALSYRRAARLGAYQGLLGNAIGNIADPAVRQMATIGGALCQADPSFDFPVLMVACDAVLVLRATHGERRVPAVDFFMGAGRTVRMPDELLVSVELSTDANSRRLGFCKFTMRSHDAAAASVAAVVALAPEHRIESIRLTIGAAVAVPTRARETETVLRGRTVREAADTVGALVAGEIAATRETRDFPNSYRSRLIPVLAERALSQAVAPAVRS